MTDQATSSSPAVAPSEIVVLHAHDFAGRPGLYSDSVEVPDGSGKVSSSHLAQAALAAALLSLEEAGAIVLQERSERQGLLGHNTAITVAAGPTPATWPEDSMEARIVAAVAGAPVALESLVVMLLQKGASDPDRQAVAVIEEGLAGRGILTSEKTRHLLITSTHYHVTESGSALAAQAPVEAVKHRLERCASERAALWKGLMDGIKLGIAARGPSAD